MLVLVTTSLGAETPLLAGPTTAGPSVAAEITIPVSPPTTQPGAIITIPPGGTAPTIIGPHNDSSDFWALAFALIGIVIAIVVVRLVFRSRIHPSRQPEEQRPGAPGTG